MTRLKPWWTAERVQRLLADLIAAEVARLRPGLLGMRGMLGRGGEALFDQTGATRNPDLGRLDLDSLEFLDLATAVVVQFQLQETGLENALLERRRLGDWAEIVLASRARNDERIGFQTSGSTGQPKSCTHRMALLEEDRKSVV